MGSVEAKVGPPLPGIKATEVIKNQGLPIEENKPPGPKAGEEKKDAIKQSAAPESKSPVEVKTNEVAKEAKTSKTAKEGKQLKTKEQKPKAVEKTAKEANVVPKGEEKKPTEVEKVSAEVPVQKT